jgi:hypothetical protein
MCTSIVEIVSANGMAKGEDSWFLLTQAVVSYDHARHAILDDAITIDFINRDLPPGARAAVELTLASAKALNDALGRAIAAAEIEESERPRRGEAGIASRPSRQRDLGSPPLRPSRPPSASYRVAERV